MKWDEIWETFKKTGLKIATNLVLILLVFLAAHIILVIISRYTGKAIEPKVTVANANEELSADNYTITYSNNVEPGTATVTVTLYSAVS